MVKLGNISDKLYPVFVALVTELSKLSWIAFIAMLGVSGALYLFGNEYGAKKLLSNSVKGFFLIQLASMLCG